MSYADFMLNYDQKPFLADITWSISKLPFHLLVLSIGLTKNANYFFATRCRFGAVSGFPGDAVHRAALRSQVPLLEFPKHHIILNSMCNCLLKNMTSDFMIINQSINQKKDWESKAIKCVSCRRHATQTSGHHHTPKITFFNKLNYLGDENPFSHYNKLN